ncbi:MAG TPA: hypothetical protein DCO77_01380 [Nitrospiraceae bacterium]|nr:hypothetical protein [Nitrospiraceae bacterium]
MPAKHTEFSIKLLFMGGLLTVLAGCVVKDYIPPISGPTSSVTFIYNSKYTMPDLKNLNKDTFNKMSSPVDKLSIATSIDGTCKFSSRRRIAGGMTKDVGFTAKARVPAGKRQFFRLWGLRKSLATFTTTQCAVSITFVPQENKSYVITYRMTAGRCELNVVKVVTVKGKSRYVQERSIKKYEGFNCN